MGDAVGVGDAVGDGVSVGVSLGVAVGEGVSVGDIVGLGLGDAVGVGLAGGSVGVTSGLEGFGSVARASGLSSTSAPGSHVPGGDSAGAPQDSATTSSSAPAAIAQQTVSCLLDGGAG